MSRLVVSSLVFAASIGCTKSPPQDAPTTTPSGERKIVVPGNDGTGQVDTKGGPGKDDARFRLAADEGKLEVAPPADAKAGGEAVVKLTLTAGSAYKVNTEFPTKLTLETTQGVTIAKAELKAGGHDKEKGDADVFSEQQLVFAVKMTPSAVGNFTINGTFKFAVCDKGGSTCLAKKEPIAIQLAAK